MDKKKPNRFDWLPMAMPGVAKLMAEKRAKHGDAHVAECWRRSMVLGEPGWFFAREGAIAIGTPWDEPEMANFAAAQVTKGQAVVVLRNPEAAGHGT